MSKEEEDVAGYHAARGDDPRGDGGSRGDRAPLLALRSRGAAEGAGKLAAPRRGWKMGVSVG